MYKNKIVYTMLTSVAMFLRLFSALNEIGLLNGLINSTMEFPSGLCNHGSHAEMADNAV